MAKRTSSITRFLEDVVDDTKDFVDDLLDRAKDVEGDVRVAVQDINDEDGRVVASSSDVAALHVALAELTAKVNQLAELQLAGAKA
jgi:polyhydroxyalkanoate synthesis regulator phasin